MRVWIDLTRLFFVGCKLRLQSGMSYRFDFVTGLVVSLLFSGVSPFVQYLIFSQTRGFPGWNVEQIILFQGMLLFFLGVRNTVFGEVPAQVQNMIWRGDFDRLLLKPYPPIGIILASGFNMNHLGTIAAGAAISVVSAVRMGLEIGFWQIALFIACLLFGLLFCMAVYIIYCCVAMLVVNVGTLFHVFEQFNRFAEYPAEIFSRVVRLAFIIVLPYMVWVYFPVQTLLHRVDFKIALAFASSLLLFALSLKLWQVCLKKYTSAGG